MKNKKNKNNGNGLAPLFSHPTIANICDSGSHHRRFLPPLVWDSWVSSLRAVPPLAQPTLRVLGRTTVQDRFRDNCCSVRGCRRSYTGRSILHCRVRGFGWCVYSHWSIQISLEYTQSQRKRQTAPSPCVWNFRISICLFPEMVALRSTRSFYCSRFHENSTFPQ